MRGRGHAWQRRHAWQRGHAWQGSVHGRRACIAGGAYVAGGGIHGKECEWQGVCVACTPPPQQILRDRVKHSTGMHSCVSFIFGLITGRIRSLREGGSPM